MRKSLEGPHTASRWRIENRLFTERRLLWGATAAAVSYALGLAWKFSRDEWPLNLTSRSCTDFIWIWLSSKFGIAGTLAQAYDYSVFAAAATGVPGARNCVLQHFDYPPTLLFFTYPVGLMPYSVAFGVWMTTTLLLYLAAVYAIIPRPAAVIAALTTYPVIFNVLMGHNGFLTAALIGLTLVFIEWRPWLSGIFLGLLTYKPQFGILFPFALLASRDWRVILSASATSVIFGLAAAIAFGYQAWPSFIDALVDRASSLNEDPTLNLPLVSVLGFLRAEGVSVRTAWPVQLAVTAIVAATVCALWARPFPYSLKAATLAIGSVLAAPHAIGYDLCILTIAAAFLVKDGLARGFLPGERAVMLMCWLGLILLTGPIPAIICIVLLMLVVRRVALCGREAITAEPPAALFRQR